MSGGAKQWGLPPPVSANSLPAHLSPAAIKVLVRRGLDTAEKLRLFLDPPHGLPYDPLRLTGMDRALQRLYQACEARERVGVFGDFDVDGVTGTAIVAEGLEAFGVRVSPYLPHRSEEGHGLSNGAIDHLAGEGASLIVTVDCGVTSAEEVAYAKGKGVDVIVIAAGFPLVLTNDPDSARELIAKELQIYGMLPSYRSMLDKEGLEGPAELAFAGDEAELRNKIQTLRDIGVTDLCASIVAPDTETFDRTRDFLASEL